VNLLATPPPQPAQYLCHRCKEPIAGAELRDGLARLARVLMPRATGSQIRQFVAKRGPGAVCRACAPDVKVAQQAAYVDHGVAQWRKAQRKNGSRASLIAAHAWRDGGPSR
jgi:hypothetical protein